MRVNQLLAQHRASKVQGGDGVSLEDYFGLESEDDRDPCGGSGEIKVRFGGKVIATMPCPRCADG